MFDERSGDVKKSRSRVDDASVAWSEVRIGKAGPLIRGRWILPYKTGLRNARGCPLFSQP